MRRLRVPLVAGWLRWGVVVLAAATLFVASVLVEPSGTASDALGPWWDTFLHAAGYTIFALVTAYATVDWRRRPYGRALVVLAIAIAIAIGYGVLIELAQATVPYRQFSPADMAANSAGALLVIGWFALETRVTYQRVVAPDRSVVPVPGREG